MHATVNISWFQYLGQPSGQQQIQQIPYVEAKKKYKNSIADKNGNAFWVA